MSDTAQRLTGAFIDADTYEPVPEVGGASVRVSFYLGARPDEEQSAKEGRPIYLPTEYVRKIVRGDKDNIVDRPVRDEDRRAYPALYREFKAAQEMEGSAGTPIAMLPGITQAHVLELAHFKIRSVEQLAKVEDKAMPALGSLAPLRDKAQRWIGAAAEAAAADRARAEADELRKELEALRARVASQEHAPKTRARRKSTGGIPVVGKGAK